MKKIILALVTTLTVSLGGCGYDSTPITATSDNEIINTELSFSNFVQINDYFYYDKTTNVVYMWYEYSFGRCTTMPTPYLNSDRVPYKYDPITNNLY